MSTLTVLDLLDLDLKEHNYLRFECVAGRLGLARAIEVAKINRPGLALSGFFTGFAASAIQLFGRSEELYIKCLEEKKDYTTLTKLFSYPFPCAIFCEGYIPSKEIKELAEKSSISLLTSPLDSAVLSRRMYALFDEILAPTETIHGVLVEVFGIGILIIGESGIGKSEIALELIERGHRLISDDAVKLRSLADSFLIGSGENPLLAHHMEIRGLGVINLTNLYGVGAIREKKEIQLVIKLEEWDDNTNYDRLGAEEHYAQYLGIRIPELVIPVKHGRSIPILIETAAKNERLKKLGYYSAREFDQKVSKWMEAETARKMYYEAITEEGENG